MDQPAYHYQKTGSQYFYVFFSNGPRGEIAKVVRISKIPDSEQNIPDGILYNIAFGDILESDGNFVFDDSARSNNGDMRKVLATVVRIVEKYMVKNKNAVLSFSGYTDKSGLESSSNQRIRLYQKIIDSNWDALSLRFQFWGILEGCQEEYIPMKPYSRILLRHK
jgi:hypothetical protein